MLRLNILTCTSVFVCVLGCTCVLCLYVYECRVSSNIFQCSSSYFKPHNERPVARTLVVVLMLMRLSGAWLTMQGDRSQCVDKPDMMRVQTFRFDLHFRPHWMRVLWTVWEQKIDGIMLSGVDWLKCSGQNHLYSFIYLKKNNLKLRRTPVMFQINSLKGQLFNYMANIDEKHITTLLMRK